MGPFNVKRRSEEEKKKSSAETILAPAPSPEKKPDDDAGKIDIIGTLLSGESITTNLDTPYGVFEFAFPSGKDQLDISYRKAQYLNGYPLTAFDVVRLSLFERWATLDVLIVSKPAQFEKLSCWADFPDQGLVEDLFERGSLFCKEIRGQISESRSSKTLG